MKIFIFAIFTNDTTSISFSLKPLSTYEERLASLLITRSYLSATRRLHFKAIMIVVDFSKKSNSVNSNDIECLICFLRLYTRYYISESLKKHLRDAFHCSLVIQLQQKVESNIAEKKIVEKSKIESSSVFAPFVKLLSTYEDKLASLNKWRNVDSKNVLIVAEFSGTNIWFKAQCIHCSTTLFNSMKKSLKEYLQQSPQCPLALQLEKKTSKIIVEIVKPTLVAADIDFFDATLLCDIHEFSLFCEAPGFVQQLRQCQHQYRESNLLTLLSECFRDPALTWYKQQRESENEIVKKSLSEWLEALITAFSAKPSAKSSSKSESSAPPAPSPPQYHSCLNCSASFSSLTRLLQHNQSVCKKAVCKHCEGAFDSKNKLHEHLRQHHATKEVDKIASGRSCNREGDKTSSTTSSTTQSTTSPTTTPKTSISRPVTPPERLRNLSTPPATPVATPKQISWALPKRSRLPLSTPKITSKRVETASTTCPLTPSATSPPMLRKSASKPYFTIDDLVRMFRGKPSPFGLPQHPKRRPSPQSPGARPPTTYQSRITAYFLPAANQKAPISQGLKSPNPKSFQQHMPAESLPPCRPALLTYLPEKSAFSPYKKPGFSYISLQSRFSSRFSFLQSRFSFAWFRFTSSPTSPSSFRSPLSDHVCCICFGRSSFRNDLFNYLDPRQRYPWNRRPMKGIWKR